MARHRKKEKSQLRLVAPGLVILVLPVLVVFGYIQLITQEPIQLHGTNTYADGYLLPTTVVPGPLALPAPTIRVVPAPEQPPPVSEAQRPVQSPTESPLTTSTTPPTQSHQEKDQQAPPSSSEAPPTKIKSISSAECSNLDSEQNVVTACNAIMAQFPNISSMGGRADRPHNPTSCHPLGEGLDVMVGSNELGDAVNKWVHDHKHELQIAFIAWEVPEHWDHVHLSFEPCKG